MAASGRLSRAWSSILVVVMLGGIESLAHGQMLGAPVLQNAFTNPGITVGLNYATSEGVRAYGLAGAWAPSTGRFQVSAGIGGFDPDDDERWPTYGGRVAVPLTRWTGTGSFGVAPFAGIGSGGRDGVTLLHAPVGVSGGYRRALGTRAISAYGAAFYSWNRISDDEGSASSGLFRLSGGLDVAVTTAIGLTVGYEAGAKADADEPGAASGVFGIGLSYAFRR
jgi:hypothetical protein